MLCQNVAKEVFIFAENYQIALVIMIIATVVALIREIIKNL